MNNEPLDIRYRRTPDLRFRTIGDEGMVVRQRAGEVLVLNDTGIRVLELLDGEISVGALLDILADEYQVETSELRQDIQAYLAELSAAGLIEPLPTSEDQA